MNITWSCGKYLLPLALYLSVVLSGFMVHLSDNKEPF